MNVRSILADKGSQVAVVGTEATVNKALEEFALHNIGALVVSNDGDRIEGILSERDVARALYEHGPDLLNGPVGEVMISDGPTCQLNDTIPELMALMTELRTRHLPVVLDDHLVGIVSIGDVVKHRVDELETLHDQMVQYIQGR
jgi:CBS domain-containing protein